MNKKFGASLSHRQCDWFKVDWGDCLELAKELGFSTLRVPVYWNEDNSVLNKQLEILSKYDFEICLQIGMKALWWPEFYFPDGIDHKTFFQSEKSGQLQARFLDYLTELVSRHESNAQIRSIQIENEPYNPSGPQNLRIPDQFFEKEIELVKSITNKEILSTAFFPSPTQRDFNRLAANENLDRIGIHYYYDYEVPILNYSEEITFRFLQLRLKLIGQKRRSRLLISELQAQPWLSKHIRAQYSPTDLYERKLKRLINLPLEEFWFWGLEFWQLRKDQYKDGSWIDMIKRLAI